MSIDFGRDLQSAYDDGMWNMFIVISNAYHGKQYYFLQDDGMVYSRDSGKYLTVQEALKEFLDKLS